MNTIKKLSIAGIGKYLPENRVLSSDLEQHLGIPAGWAVKYSGVAERRHVCSESGAFLGARALEEAMADAGITIEDLDLMLCGSATYDYSIPTMACLIKCEVEGGRERDIPAISLDTTCLGFVSGLDIASSLLDGKRYRNIALISTEIASRGLYQKDWETSTLFGDGAAAAILRWDPQGSSAILKAGMRTYSEGVYHAILKGGGNEYHARDFPYDPQLYSFQMEGKHLLRLSKKKIPEFMEEFFEDLGMNITDIDLIIPHQASKIGLLLFSKLYPFKEGQIFGNLETHGNCIAASIPMSLYDAIKSGRLIRGQTCLLAGTSAGFSIGAVLLRY